MNLGQLKIMQEVMHTGRFRPLRDSLHERTHEMELPLGGPIACSVRCISFSRHGSTLGTFVTRHLSLSPKHAPSHPRHLRHFHGGIAVLAARPATLSPGLRRQRLSTDVHATQAQGIALHEGFDAEQLDKYKADLYVVGNAMTRGKPVIEEMLNRGLPYVSGPQWLENFLRNKWVLAVAGKHGKTTTSAMLAWILEHAGLAPGFFIGGVPADFGVSARAPRGDRPSS